MANNTRKIDIIDKKNEFLSFLLKTIKLPIKEKRNNFCKNAPAIASCSKTPVILPSQGS